jgi:hypothetical protein
MVGLGECLRSATIDDNIIENDTVDGSTENMVCNNHSRESSENDLYMTADEGDMYVLYDFFCLLINITDLILNIFFNLLLCLYRSNEESEELDEIEFGSQDEEFGNVAADSVIDIHLEKVIRDKYLADGEAAVKNFISFHAAQILTVKATIIHCAIKYRICLPLLSNK